MGKVHRADRQMRAGQFGQFGRMGKANRGMLAAIDRAENFLCHGFHLPLYTG
jgi:hypothetical protein